MKDNHLITGANDALVCGKQGNDILEIAGYSDILNPLGGGNATLQGGKGDDTLIGTSDGEKRVITSYRGDLTLDQATLLQQEVDTLTGGQGNDTFVFTEVDTFEVITDFNVQGDLIQLSSEYFSGINTVLSPSSLLQNENFTVGNRASTSQHFIIYDNITGALYHDLDGSNTTFNQTQFAQLSSNLLLESNSFFIAA